jgi:outer membrane receptor protein involved in Fe transport
MLYYQLNIPRQPLDTALKDFAHQTGLQVARMSDAVDGSAIVGPIAGELSAEEALKSLLRPRGLTYKRVNERTIAIVKASTGATFPSASTFSTGSGTQGEDAVAIPSREAQTRQETKPSTDAAGERQTEALEQVVVTGVAYGSLAKQQAGFAISTLDSDQIQEFGPKTTADLFSATPGVWVESTGGDSEADLYVRGFAQSSNASFVTLELNGMPIFPPSSVGFIVNAALFRLDESIDHVEALRGGPSPILGLGQPGATFNFIQKKGGPRAEGLVKVTFTDFGTERVDGLYSGPLSNDWYYSVGGFYRTSPGYRDTQYQGDRGGQAEFQLTRQLSTGELNIFARRTADNNTWYLPIPLRSGPDGNTPEAFPGFDPGHGTYQGNDTRLATLEVSPGSPPGTLKVNSADGGGIDLTLLGATLDQDLAKGWKLSFKTLFTKGTAHTKALVGNSPITTLGDFLAQTVTTANADPAVVAAAGRPATGIVPGSLQYAGSGQPITDLTMPVMTVGWWSVDESFSSFSTDARITKELFQGNNITAGIFFTSVDFNDLWYLGSNMLLSARQNGLRINFALDNGAQATHNGFVGAPFFDRNLIANSKQTAGFIADDWAITESLRADLGGRIEHYTQDGTQEGLSTGDLDGNPLTLYDKGAVYLDGSYQALAYRKTAASWTTGLTWIPTRHFSLFGRLNSGLRFPSFDDLANGQLLTQTIRQYEIGAKAVLPGAQLSATAFRSLMNNIPFFQVVGNSTLLYGANSESNGLELETTVYPGMGFEIGFVGTYQNGHFTSGPYSGNKILHQPDYEARLAPAYAFNLGERLKARVYAAAWYVGHRFSDTQNLQPLQPFTQFNAGVAVNYGEQWDARVSCDNLTNVIGLTERDPRVIGSGVANNSFLGRPIFGRSFTLSLGYRF